MMPLPVLTGPTGSGKSSLAIELGQYYPIEIISADSRTVYKWLDIGTAKPSLVERRGVTHHLFDVITPFESYSAGQFREEVIKLVPQILNRGYYPLIVGGSGLYIKALEDLFDENLILANSELRQLLQTKSLSELQSLCELLIPEQLKQLDCNNPRRLIRALEKSRSTYNYFGLVPIEAQGCGPKPQPVWSSLAILSLECARSVLHKRIYERSQEQWRNGILIETGWLISTGLPLDAPAFTGTGYRDCADYLTGVKSRQAAFDANVAHNRQLARRQLTWIKHQYPNCQVLDITEKSSIEILKLVKDWFQQICKC